MSVVQLDEPEVTGGDKPAARPRRRALSPALAAIGAWLVCLPVAMLLPYYADLDPFGPRSMGLAIVAGAGGVAVVFALALRLTRAEAGAGGSAPWLAGVSAGLLAAWAVLAQRLALAGTPFGMGGVLDDAGRITAMVNRYTTTWATAEMWVPGLPAQYPPLYFELTGHLADLIGRPAWQVHPWVAAVVLSASILVSYLMWRRLMPDWIAFAISSTVLLAFSDGRKPYEGVVLAMVVPWVLLTFGRPPRGHETGAARGRLHWLAAGVLGAVMVTLYQAWLVFLVFGIAALAWLTWRSEEDRRGYLRHLLKVGAVTIALSAWYLAPYLFALATKGGDEVSDRYVPPALHDRLFPFLEPTLLGVVQLIGLAGLIYLRRKAWWAGPLLVLAAGAFAYRLLATVRFVATGHTTLLNYTPVLLVAILLAAAVLTMWYAGPRLVARFSLTPPAGVAATALAVLVASTTYTMARAWLPWAEPTGHYVAQAHREPLPEGGYPKYAPANDRASWFPIREVERAVESVYGPNPQRMSLSTDERLYVYTTWPGYTTMTRGGAGALVRWDERRAEIQRLAGLSDPADFTRASADTKFGPIDIFVLQDTGGTWVLRDIAFRPSQFDQADWAVFDLPEGIVVAVRRP